MRKIGYQEKAIKEVIKFLTDEKIILGLFEHEIEVQVQPSNNRHVFEGLGKIVATTKYQVQEDAGTLVITVFNGQV